MSQPLEQRMLWVAYGTNNTISDARWIPYCEEKNAYGEIDTIGEGSGASRVFRCNWADRWYLKQALMGGAVVTNIGATTSKIIARIRPHKTGDGLEYLGGAAADTYFGGWLNCIKTKTGGLTEGEDYRNAYSVAAFQAAPSVIPDTDSEQDANFPIAVNASVNRTTVASNVNRIYKPHFQYAVINAEYASLPYNVNSKLTNGTSLIWEAGGVTKANPDGSGESLYPNGRNKEWLRFCRVNSKAAGRYLNYGAGAVYKYVDPDPAKSTDFPEVRAAVFEPYSDLVIEWYQVPFCSYNSVARLLGRCNDRVCFAGIHEGSVQGYPAETLQLVGVEYEEIQPILGRHFWNHRFYFRYIQNYEPAVTGVDPPYGHNFFIRSKDLGTDPKTYQITRQLVTANGDPNGRRPIPAVFMEALFDVPSDWPVG